MKIGKSHFSRKPLSIIIIIRETRNDLLFVLLLSLKATFDIPVNLRDIFEVVLFLGVQLYFQQAVQLSLSFFVCDEGYFIPAH
jgi:hypothetical protein